MTLRRYIDFLKDFAKENPDALEMTVVCSDDDEGNSYREVTYAPSMGVFDGESDFVAIDEEEPDPDAGEPNAVCIN